MIFQHYGYIHLVPDIASVNKALSVLLNELDIYPIITTKGARHTYGSYLWHKGFDLGVIAKILGHRDISMLVEVYGHTLEEKIFEESKGIQTYTVLDKTHAISWQSEIDYLPFEGSTLIEESVFFHQKSRTLILTDLIENIELSKECSCWHRLLFKIGDNTYPNGHTPRDLRASYCS